MTTTDTKVDLVINELSEEQLQALKTAGTVTPNQLWGTPDVSDDDKVERVETIYDRTSSDSNINWGYTSGLPANTNITGKDFSKYKYLKLYVYISGAAGIYYIDLTQRQIANYIAKNVFDFGYESSSTNYLFISTCTINAEKTSITVDVYISWLTDGHTYSSPDAYYVYKIEGVY